MSRQFDLIKQSQDIGSGFIDIDGSGRVTMPYQPAFNARGTSSASYGVGWAQVTYTNAVNQRGSSYNSANSRFTAPVAGWYQFNASANFLANSDIDGAIGFIRNGNTAGDIWATTMQSQTGGNYSGRTVSGAIQLNANDYIEVWVYVTVTVTSRAAYWEGNFSGHLIS